MRRLLALLLVLAMPGTALALPQKVIIDSDFNTMDDDGQALAMAAQLDADGTLSLLGVTVVSGNQWLQQEVSDALRAVERLGLADRVGVYAGANHPLGRDAEWVRREREEDPSGDGYLGAWSVPEPRSGADLKAPPDGFAIQASPREESAVEFIVRQVKANPGEVTLLAIGPLTNIALATRRHPEIIPMIGRLVIMGGAVDVPGNTTGRAEFNWWFDPEAAKAVMRLPVTKVLVPLDVTNTVQMTKTVYDRIAHPAGGPTLLSRLYRDAIGWGFDGRNGFETDPRYHRSIWDTLALAYLIDPSLAIRTEEEWIDVGTAFGQDDGRSIGYRENPPPGLEKAIIVRQFDNERFFGLYTDLLTRPIPVFQTANGAPSTK